MTRQVEALGSSPRPLLLPATLLLLLLLPAPPPLLLLLIQSSGDNIAKRIRLCCRAKDCSILNWVKLGELRWVRKVVQPAVDCRYLLEVEVLVLVQLDGNPLLLDHPGQVARLPAPLWFDFSSLSPSKESLDPWHLEGDGGTKDGKRDSSKPLLVFTHLWQR